MNTQNSRVLRYSCGSCGACHIEEDSAGEYVAAKAYDQAIARSDKAEAEVKRLKLKFLDLIVQMKDQNRILPGEIDSVEDMCKQALKGKGE